MALREQFESSGNHLFRWRSWLPLSMLAVSLFALRDFEYPGHSAWLDALWESLCLATSVFGLSIRACTVGHAASGTSGRNTRRQLAATLNTTGAYSLVRNPLYLGNFFMGLGPAMFAGNPWLVAVYVLAFWLYYERIIFAEEAFLRERFGETWREWSERTPVFIPRFGHYRKPALPFSWRKVLRRECNGLLGVVAVLFLLECVGDIDYTGRIELDSGWIAVLSATALLWVTLRLLRKLTPLLDEQGP